MNVDIGNQEFILGKHNYQHDRPKTPPEIKYQTWFLSNIFVHYKKNAFYLCETGPNKTYCLLFSIKTCYIVGPTNNCLFQCLFTHFYIHLHHCIFI